MKGAPSIRIDLASNTCTKATRGMREAITTAGTECAFCRWVRNGRGR